jgi:hypothetical protein
LLTKAVAHPVLREYEDMSFTRKRGNDVHRGKSSKYMKRLKYLSPLPNFFIYKNGVHVDYVQFRNLEAAQKFANAVYGKNTTAIQENTLFNFAPQK